MELFTLLVNPAAVDAERMSESIGAALAPLRQSAGRVELRRVPLSGGTGIVCDIAPSSASVESLARHQTALTLAETIMRVYEKPMLERCIRKEAEFDEALDLDSVRRQCDRLLSPPEGGSDVFYERRMAKLAVEIEACLAEQPFLHVEGFLRFRAREYTEELRETVNFAIDEWMMERQYQEFISLLQYFVCIQEAKIPSAHVIHLGNHNFLLLNDLLMPIDMRQMDQFVVELIDQDINYEDVIVSTLISISPGKLYVHTPYPDQQIIKTIMTIFEGRSELCTDCSVCMSASGKRNKNP